LWLPVRMRSENEMHFWNLVALRSNEVLWFDQETPNVVVGLAAALGIIRH
jgi:hypothetical protein